MKTDIEHMRAIKNAIVELNTVIQSAKNAGLHVTVIGNNARSMHELRKDFIELVHARREYLV